MTTNRTMIALDRDVHVVAEFMQQHVAANRLVSVADQLAAIAPLLWGTYERSAVQALRLESLPIAGQIAPATSTE